MRFELMTSSLPRMRATNCAIVAIYMQTFVCFGIIPKTFPFVNTFSEFFKNFLL